MTEAEAVAEVEAEADDGGTVDRGRSNNGKYSISKFVAPFIVGNFES